MLPPPSEPAALSRPPRSTAVRFRRIQQFNEKNGFNNSMLSRDTWPGHMPDPQIDTLV
jgi:hypothetical protein